MARTINADGRTIVVPDDATDDEINQIVGPAPKPATPAPPVASPSIISRAKEYFANRPSLNDVTDGKMHSLGGPEKYVLMGAFGSGIPGAAAGFRAALPGIAKGASKMGIGAALDSAGVPAHVGTLLGAREGIPDIVGGVKEGIAEEGALLK